MDLNTWMAKLKERKRMKELGMSGVDPFAPPPTDGMDRCTPCYCCKIISLIYRYHWPVDHMCFFTLPFP